MRQNVLNAMYVELGPLGQARLPLLGFTLRPQRRRELMIQRMPTFSREDPADDRAPE